ncbi:MAG: ABC transporter ATP-binding protein [Alphaproteobacteria bacterium]|nr:ABC transporter ATP-binding protein [Alphaproteobacteria bacterium]
MESKKLNPLLELRNISYDLKTDSGDTKQILKDINLTLYENDFVGITGKSGSGKTTLLKIIAGLLGQTKGRVLNFGHHPKITVVFEEASLFPWLNVQENIQLGLRSSHLPEKDETNKIEEVIDLIGLGDYTKSYPKELSAGMKQRVNFARALASEPDILLMDDPFVSLDILTAESLKNDLYDFLNQDIVKIKAMLMVTHNIHDIMMLCSSVLVMKNKPAELHTAHKIDLPFPRVQSSKKYNKVLEEIYKDLSDETNLSIKGKRVNLYKNYLKLSGIPPSSIIGLITILVKRYEGSSDSNALIKELQLKDDEFALILSFAELLNFIRKKDGKIKITAFGHTVIETHIPEEQQILFGKQLIKEIPIMKIIKSTESKRKIKTMMSKSLTEKQAQKTADTLITWAKFGKLI